MVEGVPCVVDVYAPFRKYVPVVHSSYRTLPLGYIVSCMNSFRILTFCFLRFHFNVIFPLVCGFRSLLLEVSHLKFCMHSLFLHSVIWVTYFIPLDLVTCIMFGKEG